MKNGGIVRRIDELGRLVIPKEIRKSLRIKEGDSVEIFHKGDSVIINRYSSIEILKDYANLLINSVYKDINKNIIVTDTSKVISAVGPCKKEYLDKNISDSLIEAIIRRENILEKYCKSVDFINNKIETSYIISSIISNGDVKGCIIMFDEKDNVNNFDYKVIKIITNFLSKSIEEY